MFKAILNIALAFLMLVASTGMVLSKHYCGGRLLGVSVYKAAESCGHSSESTCHKQASDDDSDKKGCCDNTITYVKGIDLETSTMSVTQALPTVDFVMLSFIIPTLMDSAIEHVTVFSTFQPPPLVRYLPVLFQSFLL